VRRYPVLGQISNLVIDHQWKDVNCYSTLEPRLSCLKESGSGLVGGLADDVLVALVSSWISKEVFQSL